LFTQKYIVFFGESCEEVPSLVVGVTESGRGGVLGGGEGVVEAERTDVS
jgi:hypothetical protein